MKPLPAHEQLSVSTDRPLIERWLDDNLEAAATVALDREASAYAAYLVAAPGGPIEVNPRPEGPAVPLATG